MVAAVATRWATSPHHRIMSPPKQRGELGSGWCVVVGKAAGAVTSQSESADRPAAGGACSGKLHSTEVNTYCRAAGCMHLAVRIDACIHRCTLSACMQPAPYGRSVHPPSCSQLLHMQLPCMGQLQAASLRTVDA
jgi:hypothetical protein